MLDIRLLYYPAFWYAIWLAFNYAKGSFKLRCRFERRLILNTFDVSARIEYRGKRTMVSLRRETVRWPSIGVLSRGSATLIG